MPHQQHIQIVLEILIVQLKTTEFVKPVSSVPNIFDAIVLSRLDIIGDTNSKIQVIYNNHFQSMYTIVQLCTHGDEFFCLQNSINR